MDKIYLRGRLDIKKNQSKIENGDKWHNESING